MIAKARGSVQSAVSGRGLPVKHRSASTPSREEGSILVLILGLCLLLLLIASTVLGVSSVHLERHRLQALADQSATSAAQRVEGIGTGRGGGALAVLSPQGVRQTAETFIEQGGAAADFSNLALDPATGVEGSSTAVVVLTATAHPPLVSLVVPAGFDIRVIGRARVQTTQQQ